MKYSDIFEQAFLMAMQSEVGAHFDPNDPETIQGLCETKSQKRKTGYVNDPLDAGGETKYGIAKNANPDLDIKSLNLEMAKKRYYDKYWVDGKCENFPSPINLLHFDCTVNSGGKTAGKNLQRALNFPEANVDGLIGPITIATVKSADIKQLTYRWLDERKKFYERIVAKKPDQQRFFNGWMNRVAHLKQVAESILN